MPNESAIPRTSPVERISGPRSGSTSGNMLKGKTASLTPKWEMDLGCRFSSANFFPNMTWVARRAIGILQTLETNGTVREPGDWPRGYRRYLGRWHTEY